VRIISAYGKRQGLSSNVRRRPPRPSFLGSAFAAYRQCTLFFAGVAVRVAVQASAVKQRLMLRGEGHCPFPAIPCHLIGSLREKMTGSHVIYAIGFPSVCCVQHTPLAFIILGRDHLDFCMISVSAFIINSKLSRQNWGNLMLQLSQIKRVLLASLPVARYGGGN
jgi:hypothetical protein